MNLLTPAVPCLRQVVNALADPASLGRPWPPVLAGSRSPGLHLRTQPDPVPTAVCSPREPNAIARGRTKQRRRLSKRLVFW